VGFDEVRPGSLSGGEDGVNAQSLKEGQEARVVVDVVEVVQDHEESLSGIARTESPEGLEQIGETLLPTKEGGRPI
jgi:hypothetical protein